MRISDWSSDVCSSDLLQGRVAVAAKEGDAHERKAHRLGFGRDDRVEGVEIDQCSSQGCRPESHAFLAAAARGPDVLSGYPCLGVSVHIGRSQEIGKGRLGAARSYFVAPEIGRAHV